MRVKVAENVNFVSLLSFVSESYILLAISCFANFNNFQFKTPGEIFSGIFAQIGAIVLIAYPVFLILFTFKNKNKIKNTEFRKKYSPIYENMASNNDRTTLLISSISVIRVLILAAVIIYLQKYRYFQIFFSNFFSIFMIIYIGQFEPLNKEVHFWQQYNESFVTLMNYHLICFADLILDEPTRNFMGFSMIAVYTFNLVTNISFIMYGEIRKLCIAMRGKYYKWRIEKLKKQIKENRKKARQIKEEKKISPRLQYILNH